MFANQLGLNGTLTLYAAGKSRLSAERDNIWEPSMPADKAVVVTRDLLLGPNEQLVDSDPAAVRRDYQAPADTRLPRTTNILDIAHRSLQRIPAAIRPREW